MPENLSETSFWPLMDRFRKWKHSISEEQLLLYFVAIGVFIDTLSSGMVIPLLPSFALKYHLSQSAITALLTLRALTSVLLAGPAGLLVTVVGFRTLLLVVLGGTVAASALLAWPWGASWHLLAVAMVLQGLCTEVAWTTGLSLAAFTFGGQEPSDPPASDGPDPLPQEEPLLKPQARGEEEEEEGTGVASGLVGAIGLLFGSSSLGYLIGPFCGAVLFQYTTPWMPFVSVIALSVSVMLLLLCVMENSPKRKEEEGKERKEEEEEEEEEVGMEEGVRTNGPMGAQKQRDSLRAAFLVVGQDKTVLFVLFITALTALGTGALEVLLPFHGTDVCHLSTAQVGLVFASLAVAFTAATALAESFVSSVGPTSCVRLGLLGQALVGPAVFVASPFVCSAYFQCAGGALFGASLALNSTPCFPVIVDVLDKKGIRSYAVGVSLYNAAYTVGSAGGPLVASALVAASLAPTWTMAGVSVFVLLCVPFAVLDPQRD